MGVGEIKEELEKLSTEDLITKIIEAQRELTDLTSKVEELREKNETQKQENDTLKEYISNTRDQLTSMSDLNSSGISAQRFSNKSNTSHNQSILVNEHIGELCSVSPAPYYPSHFNFSSTKTQHEVFQDGCDEPISDGAIAAGTHASTRYFADIVNHEIENKRIKLEASSSRNISDSRNQLDVHKTNSSAFNRVINGSNESQPQLYSNSISRSKFKQNETKSQAKENQPLYNADDETPSESLYGYSDSESSILAPDIEGQKKLFKSIEDTFRRSSFNYARKPVVQRRSPSSETRQWRRPTYNAKQNFKGIGAGHNPKHLQVANEFRVHSLDRRTHGSRLNPGTSLSCQRRQINLSDGEVPLAAAQKNSLCNVSDDNIRAIVKENLVLQRKIEEIEEKFKVLEGQTKAERLKLLDAMAEKHQRRILLLQQEFNFRLEKHKEEAERKFMESCEREYKSSQQVRSLQQKVNELETAEKMAQEKAKSEECRVEAELKQGEALKAQLSGALATISQFSEKNSTLLKEIEALKLELEDKTLLQKRLSNILEESNSLRLENNHLSQQLIESKNEGQVKDSEISRLTKEVHLKEVEIAKNQFELQSAKSMATHFRQKHSRCLDSRNSWEEVALIKQEEVFLRQQLIQQELAMEKLKEFSKRHEAVVNQRMVELEGYEMLSQLHSDDRKETALPDPKGIKVESSLIAASASAAGEEYCKDKLSVPVLPIHSTFSMQKKSGYSTSAARKNQKLQSSSSASHMRLPPHATDWLNNKKTAQRKFQEQSLPSSPSESNRRVINSGTPSPLPSHISSNDIQIFTKTTNERPCSEIKWQPDNKSKKYSSVDNQNSHSVTEGLFSHLSPGERACPVTEFNNNESFAYLTSKSNEQNRRKGYNCDYDENDNKVLLPVSMKLNDETTNRFLDPFKRPHSTPRAAPELPLVMHSNSGISRISTDAAATIVGTENMTSKSCGDFSVDWHLFNDHSYLDRQSADACRSVPLFLKHRQKEMIHSNFSNHSELMPSFSSLPDSCLNESSVNVNIRSTQAVPVSSTAAKLVKVVTNDGKCRYELESFATLSSAPTF